jgi:hypothetical protein
MKIWRAKFGGVWLGGGYVVAAETKEQAAEMFVAEATRLGSALRNDMPELDLEEVPLDAPSVIYFDDGDY